MKKVYKKALIGFREAAYKRVQAHAELTGQNETEAVNDLLAGNSKFGPNAETWLAGEIKRTGKTREAVLESLVLEAMSRASSPGEDVTQRENDMLSKLLRKALEAEKQQPSSKPRK